MFADNIHEGRSARHRISFDQRIPRQPDPTRPVEVEVHTSEQTDAHLHEDDYLLLFSEQLEPDRLEMARTHLAACSACQAELTAAYFAAVLHGRVGGRRSDHIRTTIGERRIEYRHPVQDAAILRVLCPFRVAPAEICIIDVSRHGVRFRSPQMLHPGTLVQVRTTRLIILAEARHCVPADQGAWYVGCQINDVFEPNAI